MIDLGAWSLILLMVGVLAGLMFAERLGPSYKWRLRHDCHCGEGRPAEERGEDAPGYLSAGELGRMMKSPVYRHLFRDPTVMRLLASIEADRVCLKKLAAKNARMQEKLR